MIPRRSCLSKANPHYVTNRTDPQNAVALVTVQRPDAASSRIATGRARSPRCTTATVSAG
jgi:hypothetical protein